MIISQGNDNLLHYTYIFMETMTGMMDLETNIAIHAYMRGLRLDSLLDDNLIIHKIRMLSELFSRAMLYIEVEEL